MKKTTVPAKKPATKAPVKAAAKAPAAKGKAPAAKDPAKKAAPAEKKVEAPVEAPKEEEKIQTAEAVKEQMARFQIKGESVIKFNHYNQSFKHVDGMISWDAIDEEYCFSDVYEDGYELKMIIETENPTQEFKNDNYLVC